MATPEKHVSIPIWFYVATVVMWGLGGIQIATWLTSLIA